MRRTSLCFVAVALLLTAKPAYSSDLRQPAPRQGYYLAAGALAGCGVSEDEKLGRFAPLYGGGAVLRVGQMANAWLGFGMQFEYGLARNSRWQQQSGGALLLGQAVPFENLAMHAGAGWGFARATDTRHRIDRHPGVGGAYYDVALSYDFFPWHASGSGGISLTPTVQAKLVPAVGFNAWMIWGGLEVIWWAGLPRHQLDLPSAVGW
jgi:hypothetical protein